MDFTANIDFSPSGLSVIASHPHRPFVIILKINPAGCDYFFCDEGRTIGVDLMDFRIKLTSLNFGDDGSVCIAISAEEGTITFYFERNEQERPTTECFEMEPTEVVDRLLPMNSLPGIYAATIRISSEDFRRIFRHDTFIVTVDISVWNHQVKIRSSSSRGHVELVLSPENEESTIEGTISEEPLNFQVTLYSVDLLMEASNLTDTLSMHVDDVKPLLLNFPIGSLGNLMFFYYQNEF